MNHKGTKKLETERLVLREFKLSDALNMYNNWASNPNVTKFLIWEPYKSVEDVEEYIKTVINEYEKLDKYDWVIVEKSSGQAIGNISVVKINEPTSCMKIGYCLGEKFWHNGIMTEAFMRVIKFLFEEVGCNRIEATHDVSNPNSGKVMEKCGLKYEGTLRQSSVNNQGVYDCVVRSILKSEY
ncbi:MAG: GNAT family N-acetyltransferase [Ruminococcus sp.]|nr:GNAT family N-acetyltransferase [Ruminococcus sp.]